MPFLRWLFMTSRIVLLFSSLASCSQNPILPGWNPDPSPLRVGDWYYLAVSSFEYWPGVPIYRSPDLVNWDLFSHVLTRPEQLHLYGSPTGAGMWAPSLSHKDDTFYLATMQRWIYDPTARVWPRIFWVTSTDLKTWSDPTWAEPWGIDPELFHDPVSQKDYLNLASVNNDKDRLWGIYQCEVDVLSGMCVGDYRSMWNGTLEHNSTARPEGPKMFSRDGYYYLLIAEGGTDAGHRATIARSSSPEGPWEADPNNPILWNGNPDNGNLTIQSTGHGTMVTTPEDDWYITYLGRRNVNGSSPLGRETFISSVKWQNDWPVVNGGKPVLLSEAVAELPQKKPAPVLKKYDFSGDLHSSGWYTLRTPYTKIYTQGTVSSRNSCDNGDDLYLHPNVFNLNDRDVPSAIFHKQASLNMTFTATTLAIPDTLRPGAAVGISAYLSELAHHDIAVSACRNATGLCIYSLFWRNGTETYTEVQYQPLSSDRSLELIIRAEPLTYSLGFCYPEGEVQWIGKFESYWMAWPPTGYFVFTGAMFALFATGNGKPWGANGPKVGFCGVEEEFRREDGIGNFDVLR